MSQLAIVSPPHLPVPRGRARLLILKIPRRTETGDTVLLRLSLGASLSLACLVALKMQLREVSRSGAPHAILESRIQQSILDYS